MKDWGMNLKNESEWMNLGWSETQRRTCSCTTAYKADIKKAGGQRCLVTHQTGAFNTWQWCYKLTTSAHVMKHANLWCTVHCASLQQDNMNDQWSLHDNINYHWKLTLSVNMC